MSNDPYCRLRWRFADEFPEVWDDDSTNALWHRLLRIGDMAWPADGVLPYKTKRKALQALIDHQLIEEKGGGRFRVRGMDKERAARSNQARRAAYARHADSSADSNALSTAQSMPSRAKPSKAKPSQAEQDAGARAYYAIKGGQVSEKALAFVDDLVRDYGDDETAWAIGAEARATSVDREFLSRVKGRLILEARQREHEAEARRKTAEAEYQRQLREGVESMTPEQRAENMARLKEAIDGVKEMP